MYEGIEELIRLLWYVWSMCHLNGYSGLDGLIDNVIDWYDRVIVVWLNSIREIIVDDMK